MLKKVKYGPLGAKILFIKALNDCFPLGLPTFFFDFWKVVMLPRVSSHFSTSCAERLLHLRGWTLGLDVCIQAADRNATRMQQALCTAGVKVRATPQQLINRDLTITPLLPVAHLIQILLTLHAASLQAVCASCSCYSIMSLQYSTAPFDETTLNLCPGSLRCRQWTSTKRAKTLNIPCTDDWSTLPWTSPTSKR